MDCEATPNGQRQLCFSLGNQCQSLTPMIDPLSIKAAQRGNGNSSYQQVQVSVQAATQIASTKQFVWNRNLIAEERDANNTITRRFYEEGEQISGTSYYYTRDHLGSVREMTDSTGAFRARYDYDPYGYRTKLSGDLDAQFGFTGHYFHQPSGLNLALYRGYDANTGRWISRDPIEEAAGINLYRYISNRPIRLVDPLGLEVDEPYPGESGTLGTQRGGDLVNQAPTIVNHTIRDAAIDIGTAVLPELGILDRLLNLLRLGKKCEKIADYGTTPGGRPFTKHYCTETGPVRNLPGTVVDNTIENATGVPVSGGKTVYYDPVNNVTVVTGDGGSIVSARKGKP